MADLILFLFLLATGINVFYWLFFYALKNPEKLTQRTLEPISIIICAHNEYHNLKEYLPKILSQKNVSYEVIVVNDRSTDKSLSFLESITSPLLKVVSISYVPPGWNPKKWALLSGVKHAQHENLLFTDADCYPSTDEWAAAFAGSLANNDLVLGYSPQMRENGYLNSFIRFETLVTAYSYMGFALKKLPYMAVGRNFGTKRKLYLNFSFKNVAHLVGGDDDLFVNDLPSGVKTRAIYHPHFQVLTKAKKTIKEYLNQKKRHLAVSNSYSIKSKFFLGLYNLSSIVFYSLGIFLAIVHPEKSFVFGALLLRTTILFVIFGNNSRKLGDKSLDVKCIILDFLYTLFLWVWGPVALLAKKVKWK